MRIGIYNIEPYFHWRRKIESKDFVINFSHKYWYLWDAYFDLYWFVFTLEIARTDWNKCYKSSCANYTSICKHCMDCNQCKECYKAMEEEV